MLADSIWRQRFGGDPAIVGRKIMLGGAPYTVVGVLPAGFRIPEAVRRYGQAAERTHGNFPALRVPAESDYSA